MSIKEAQHFAALNMEIQRLKAELRLTKAKVKLGRVCGYNRALRSLAKHPTGGLLTQAWRQGRRHGE